MNDTQSSELQLPQTCISTERRPVYIYPGDGRFGADDLMLSQFDQNGVPVAHQSIDNYDNDFLRTSRVFCSDTAHEIQRHGMMWMRRLIVILSDAPIFPAAKVFYYAFHYVPDEEPESAANDLASSDLHIISSQYQAKAESMSKAWETIKLASVFFIGAAPVILQIQPVYMNVVPRALIVASGLLAMASLVSGHLYVQANDRFMQTRVMNERWRKAANNSGDTFWTLVALPFAFILWSAVFFLGTVGYFVWGIAFALNSIADEATQAKGVQYGELVVSATFVTSIPIYAFYKIYNVMTELHGNG